MQLLVRHGEDNTFQEGRLVTDHRSQTFGRFFSPAEVVITPESDPPLRTGFYYVSVRVFARDVRVNCDLKVEEELGGPPPIEYGTLTPGRPVEISLVPVRNPTLFNRNYSYQLEVPEDASSVTLTLESVFSGVDTDLELLVRYGEDNRIQDGRLVTDYSSRTPTGGEEIVITPQSDPPLRAGTYFVSIVFWETRTFGTRLYTLRAEVELEGGTLPSSQIYYFPHLAVGSSWQTTITYINYSAEEVSCRTDFLSDQGDPLLVSFPGQGTVDRRADVLPPGGSFHEETDVELGAALASGWARATCSGPVKSQSSISSVR